MKEAVVVFFALSTQWNFVGGFAGGMRTGLKYEAIEPTVRGLAIEYNPGLFHDLRAMEMEALSAMSRKHG